MSQLQIGTSGWVYKHWMDIFYPPHLPSYQQRLILSQVRLITCDYRICAKIPKASFPLLPAPLPSAI